MTLRTTALLLSTLLATPLLAEAQQINIPASVGQTVWVTTADGWDVRGVVARVSATDLALTTEDGVTHFDTAEIWRVSTTDSIWSGAMIGAGIGVGVSFMGSSYRPASETARQAFMTGLMYGAIGAKVDHANKGKHVIYERAGARILAPPVTPVTPAVPVTPTVTTPSAAPTVAPALPVRIGQEVTVTTAGGREVAGFVSGISATAIDVRSDSGTKHMSATEVRRITTPHASTKGRKTLGVYGAASGALVGLMLDGSAQAVVITSVMCAGMMSGIGLALDHAAGGRKTIYEKNIASETAAVRVAPILTLHSAGVGGSISWK